MADSRYTHMNWAPRWIDAYYTDTSVLGKFYFLSLFYYFDYMRQILGGYLFPKYYGEIGQPKYFFFSKYHFPYEYIPIITLYSSGYSPVQLKEVKTYGDLIYEIKDPVFLRQDGLILHNLDVKRSSITATSGFLNLTSSLLSDPIEPDSGFVLENNYGDLTYIDQTSMLYIAASSHILVSASGTYNVYYHSSLQKARLEQAINFIAIDGIKTEISEFYNPNIWDTYADLYEIKRNKWENNSSLKKKCQHFSIANKPNQRIAVALGKTLGVEWYTSGATINLSGMNDWVLQDCNYSFYLTEGLTKLGSTFVFSYPPTGYIQVLYNNNKVQDNAYIVSGSYLIPTNTTLMNAGSNEILVRYKHQHIRGRSYPELSTAISAINPDGFFYRGILIQNDVLLKKATKKPTFKDWKWNINNGINSGLAGFDF